MEQGRAYAFGKGTIVVWKLRFLFASDEGLCCQRLSRDTRPIGGHRCIPWADITTVEAVSANLVYVEIAAQKSFFLKVNGTLVQRACLCSEVDAYSWARQLCELAHLLGSKVTGNMARHIWHRKPDTCASRSPDTTPTSSYNCSPCHDVDQKQDDCVVHSGDETSEEDEFEATRRHAWIEYYVTLKKFDKAEEIGWDLMSPIDPRNDRSLAESQSAPMNSPSGSLGVKSRLWMLGLSHNVSRIRFARGGRTPSGSRGVGSLGLRTLFGRRLIQAEWSPSLSSNSLSQMTPKQSALRWLELTTHEAWNILPSSCDEENEEQFSNACQPRDQPRRSWLRSLLSSIQRIPLISQLTV